MAQRGGSLKFAAFLGTVDEADILPTTIEQLRAIGVELIVVLDSGSSDETMAYLATAERRGDIWVWHFDRDRPSDALHRSGTSALAAACQAEWVLFLDSDELALPRSGSLHDLDDLEEFDILSVPRYNVVVGPDGPYLPASLAPEQYDQILLYAQPIPDFYHYMQRRPETAWIRGVLEPKTLIRGSAITTLQRGAHDADPESGRVWRRAIARDLMLAHLPFRTLERFQMRSDNIVSELDANPDDYTSWYAWQWQRFARFAREGRTAEEFDRQVIDDDEVASLRDRNVVRSAGEVFAQPITSATDDESWRELAARAEPWLTAAALVGRREGLDPGGKLEHISGSGPQPVVSLPPDHVVKFYARWEHGYDRQQRENALLRRFESDGELEAPNLVAEGNLEPDLRYSVVTRIRGVRLADLDYDVGPEVRKALGHWTGRFVRRMQSLPVAPKERSAAWARYVMAARRRHTGIEDLAEARGFSGHFSRHVREWLPPLDAMLGSLDEAVICHGDFDAQNLMGRPARPRFEPTGVLGFGDWCLGHPLMDLGSLWWRVLGRDHEALDAFLTTAELRPSTPETARIALAWALMAPSAGESELVGEEADSDPDVLAEQWFGGWWE